MRVTLLHCPAPRQHEERQLELEPGATVRDALQRAGLAAEAAADPRLALTVGIWGRKAGMDQVLREGDRVELYRPLQVDPKLARRERFNRQGKRAAGLFARRKGGGSGD